MYRQDIFSGQVSDFLLGRHGSNLEEVVLVVPSYAVGNEVLAKVGQRLGKSLWAPFVYTINDLMGSLSSLVVPNQVRLLAVLHEVADKRGVAVGPFEDFLVWGRKLLDDFNRIDDAMVDVEALCKWKGGLDSAEAGDFFASLSGLEVGAVDRWHLLWDQLPYLYGDYKERLLGCKQAYAGLQRRNLCDSLQSGDVVLPFRHIVVVGLHAFSRVEETIFRLLKRDVSVDFCWDNDSYYCKEGEQHAAGYYFRRREGDTTFKQALAGGGFASDMEGLPMKVEVVGAMGLRGQLASLEEEIAKHIAEVGHEEVCAHTAIIIPDHGWLVPLLEGLSSQLGDLVIRGGYPLKETPAYRLLLALLGVQLAWGLSKGMATPALMQALRTLAVHPYVAGAIPNVEHFIKAVIRTSSDLPEDIVLAQIGLCFLKIKARESLFEFIQKCFSIIKDYCKGKTILSSWEQEAMRETIAFWDEIAGDWPADQIPDGVSQAFWQWIHRASQGVFLPVQHSGLSSGIEVMRLRDSLGRDFKYVYILGMNEGVYPPSLHHDSLIPAFLKKAFNLRKKQGREALTAYPFYRLLHRTKKMVVFYGTGSDEGGRSRYLYEIPYALGWPLGERTLSTSVSLVSGRSVVIEKSKQVLKRLSTFLIKEGGAGRRTLTPSALNSYLDCPCCFYLQYIVGLSLPQEVTIEVDSLVFGQLFHAVMEALYRPYVGRSLGKGDFDYLGKHVMEVIAKVYGEQVEQARYGAGMDRVVQKVLGKFCHGVLQVDAGYAPFILHGVEHHYRGHSALSFLLSNGESVALGGVLDRIDEKGGVVRVLDYKTGHYTAAIPTIESLFVRENLSRNRVAMQLLWYAWLYGKRCDIDVSRPIVPTVMSTRTLFTPLTGATFTIGMGKDRLSLNDIGRYSADFEGFLRACLDELFDPNVPFVQSASHRHMPYGICHAMGL